MSQRSSYADSRDASVSRRSGVLVRTYDDGAQLVHVGGADDRRTIRMSPSNGLDPTDDVTMDPMIVLSRLPRDAQLLLRDHIAGLEAQAGSARAIADRLQRVREQDIDRLLLKVAGAHAERDAAVKERDKAFGERDAALRTITELTGRHQVVAEDSPGPERPRRSFWSSR